MSTITVNVLTNEHVIAALESVDAQIRMSVRNPWKDESGRTLDQINLLAAARTLAGEAWLRGLLNVKDHK
ncbi:MAG TPA: hypothetical protein VLA89_13665 [Gemmatimonadales bacterium]|nr:hypothetical protein [Gemmatimonadales bacterium]